MIDRKRERWRKTEEGDWERLERDEKEKGDDHLKIEKGDRKKCRSIIGVLHMHLSQGVYTCTCHRECVKAYIGTEAH